MLFNTKNFMNHFNKFLIILTLTLSVTYSYILIKEKPWSKFYYEAFAFYPEAFPVEFSRIEFTSNAIKDIDYGYYSNINIYSDGFVNWSGGGGFSNQNVKKRFLPDNLYLEYIDLQTEKYYRDTIPLPKKKMEEIFKKAKGKNMLQDLDSYYTCMGLTLQVGIANDGNILVWLSNTDYRTDFEIEILKTKILPKTFPRNWDKYTIKNEEKKVILQNIFNRVSNYEKEALIKGIDSTANYKDSIPSRFKNLIESL